jgi:F-type H+-transporting ATPase subunit b
LPQLDVGTFPSQIFWILIGFLLVYLFISRKVAPEIEQTFRTRADHLNDLSKRAQRLKSEAEKLESDSRIALESAHLNFSANELKLISVFQEQSKREKASLETSFAQKSQKELQALAKSSSAAFDDVCCNIDGILEIALGKISNFRKNRS